MVVYIPTGSYITIKFNYWLHYFLTKTIFTNMIHISLVWVMYTWCIHIHTISTNVIDWFFTIIGIRTKGIIRFCLNSIDISISMSQTPRHGHCNFCNPKHQVYVLLFHHIINWFFVCLWLRKPTVFTRLSAPWFSFFVGYVVWKMDFPTYPGTE